MAIAIGGCRSISRALVTFFFLAGVFLLQLCMSQENCQSSFEVGVDDDAILAFGELNSGSD